MTPAEAIQTLQQFEMLDDEQVQEVCDLIAAQAAQIEQQAAEITSLKKQNAYLKTKRWVGGYDLAESEVKEGQG